jgi:hypothetical protein
LDLFHVIAFFCPRVDFQRVIVHPAHVVPPSLEIEVVQMNHLICQCELAQMCQLKLAKISDPVWQAAVQQTGSWPASSHSEVSVKVAIMPPREDGATSGDKRHDVGLNSWSNFLARSSAISRRA